MADTDFDLFIIGGGINGCGIARDAAGRGLSVGLAEMNDLASATSSASTKLFHGGLRYLEYFEVRLVREALIERETPALPQRHAVRRRYAHVQGFEYRDAVDERAQTRVADPVGPVHV